MTTVPTEAQGQDMLVWVREGWAAGHPDRPVRIGPRSTARPAGRNPARRRPPANTPRPHTRTGGGGGHARRARPPPRPRAPLTLHARARTHSTPTRLCSAA
jgi:hypothetical protein